MERLESKKINGHTYYYYSIWSWVNGKCRRTFQKYLGKPADIMHAIENNLTPIYAEVFQYGLPITFWQQLLHQQIISTIDKLCPKRNQGLSIGKYLGLAAINRAIAPTSKNGLWDWFQQTSLHRFLHDANRQALCSQRFWDHMDAVSIEMTQTIWRTIIKETIQRENIKPSSICYDGTNFYTFIDTFNTQCSLAQRGKNKQGRSNLRQVSYALFCTAEEQIPLCFDIYEGNKNDCPEFAHMITKFREFLLDMGYHAEPTSSLPITLIFDKGNNSADNIALLDHDNLHFIGSVKLDEHKDLSEISNNDTRFVPCVGSELEAIRAFSLNKIVYGKTRKVIVCFNPTLFNTQWLTLNNDIAHALQGLQALQRRLKDRAMGIIKGGNVPTVTSVDKQVEALLKRPFLNQIIATKIQDSSICPLLAYEINVQQLEKVADTWLGKKIIITTHFDWSTEHIIEAYHSQFAIEHIFKHMKDRTYGIWWPMYHWTNQKIHIHGLYCTIAVLIRALVYQKIRTAHVPISYERAFCELDQIREVVNVFKRKKAEKRVTVLTRLNEIQEKLIEVLQIPPQPQNAVV